MHQVGLYGIEESLEILIVPLFVLLLQIARNAYIGVRKIGWFLSSGSEMVDRLRNFSYIGVNESVCLRVDDAFVDIIEMREKAHDELIDPSSVIVPAILLLLSIAVLLFGARLLRFAAAFAAGGFAFYVSYTLIRQSGQNVTCEVLLIASTFVAIVAALASSCIYKAGLFFVGAAAMAGVVHLVFASFPNLNDIGNQPTIAEKSFAYWGLLILAAVAGGLVLRWHSRPILEVITSCVGGAGLAYSLHSINSVANASVDNWVFMLSGLVACIVGMLVQRHLRLRGCKSRQARPQVAVSV